jgi:membrane associated rhomboid family serine protease
MPVVHVGRRAACPSCRTVLRVVARDWDLQFDDFADTLVVQSGPGCAGEQFFIGGQQPITIGKLGTNDIVLNGELVSRAHCRLVRTGSGWRIEDQKSRNGLLVNGQRVETHDLCDGDILRVGEFELKVQIPARRRSPVAASPATGPESSAEPEDHAVYKLADEDTWRAAVAATAVRPVARMEDPAAAEGLTCPSCGQRLKVSARICVQCGINVKTGRTILTTHDANLDQIYITAENVIHLLSWIVWTGVYPIASEAFGTRKPYVIRSLAVLTILVSVWYWAYEWTGSPRMQSLKNFALWTGAAEPASEQVHAFYEFTSYGDSEAFDEKYRELQGSVPDHDLTLAAHHALPPEKQCFGTYRNSQLITHAFLHGDILHLAGNLLLLLVLGSRVNALIGNIGAAVIYPLLAIAGGIAHRLAYAHLPPQSAVGASGAIMGLAGMYLILFPVHKVHLAGWIRWGLYAGFRLSLKIWSVRGFWVVLFAIALDVIATTLSFEDNIAHWAHLGGFLAGAGLAILLLLTRLVNSRGGDILSVVLGKYAWPLIGRPNPTRKALLGG